MMEATGLNDAQTAALGGADRDWKGGGLGTAVEKSGRADIGTAPEVVIDNPAVETTRHHVQVGTVYAVVFLVWLVWHGRAA